MQESETLAPGQRPEPSPKRKRLGLRILLVAAAALAWIVAVVGVFVWRYQPLSSDSFAPISAQQTEFAGTNNDILVATYQEGKATGYIFDLRNLGRFGVRITSVSVPGRPGDLLQTTGLSMSKTPDSCCSARPDTVVPFHPFSLGPGHSIGIVVRQRFANCDRFSPGMAQTFDFPTIAYKILGITKHQLIQPGQERVPSPPDSDCPSRSP